MDCVQDRIMDHFLSSLIEGKKYSHDVNKAIFAMARMSKSTRLHMRAFRDEYPAEYGAYRRQGMREHIVQVFEIDECRYHDGSHYSLQHRLIDQGLLTAEPGRDWYAAHFRDWELLEVLKQVDMLKGCDRDWLAKNVKEGALINALESANLLTQDCDRDWYAAHLEQSSLKLALSKVGYLTRDTPLEWYESHFSGYMLFGVLLEAGYFTSDMSFEWYADRFDGRPLYDALRHAQALGHADHKDKVLKKYGNTMYMMDLIRDAPYMHETKEWYARYVSKGDIRLALKTVGLWNADLNKDWMAKNLRKTDVFKALQEFDMIGDCGVEWIKSNLSKRDIAKALSVK